MRSLVFESVRELLFNAVKHSHARSAAVNLRMVAGQLQIVVSDQGAGFDPKSLNRVGKPGGGFGLFSIRERLDLVGGNLEIDSRPGKGSRFVLTVPIAAAAAAPPAPVAVAAEPDGDGIPPGWLRRFRAGRFACCWPMTTP